MEPHSPVVRRARVDDAAALATFAARAFQEAFGADNTAEDMAAYLHGAYGKRQQEAEISNPDIVTLLIEEHGVPVAFSQVRRGPVPPCVVLPLPVEVWRFYVDVAWHGRGLARHLMRASLHAALELGGASVWLSVWERNARAIAFYAKCGFHDVGTKVFVVGSDHQIDRVMARAVTAASAV